MKRLRHPRQKLHPLTLGDVDVKFTPGAKTSAKQTPYTPDLEIEDNPAAPQNGITTMEVRGRNGWDMGSGDVWRNKKDGELPDNDYFRAARERILNPTHPPDRNMKAPPEEDRKILDKQAAKIAATIANHGTLYDPMHRMSSDFEAATAKGQEHLNYLVTRVTGAGQIRWDALAKLRPVL